MRRGREDKIRRRTGGQGTGGEGRTRERDEKRRGRVGKNGRRTAGRRTGNEGGWTTGMWMKRDERER
jgi:hypothetical protein